MWRCDLKRNLLLPMYVEERLGWFLLSVLLVWESYPEVLTGIKPLREYQAMFISYNINWYALYLYKVTTDRTDASALESVYVFL